jgi:hypothetical protein
MMRRAGIAYILILLLLSAVFDDAWARTTPEPTDDVQAAENNDYLPSSPPQHKRSVEKHPPVSGVPHSAVAGPTADSARGRLVGERPAALWGPSLLYLFLSLRW